MSAINIKRYLSLNIGTQRAAINIKRYLSLNSGTRCAAINIKRYLSLNSGSRCSAININRYLSLNSGSQCAAINIKRYLPLDSRTLFLLTRFWSGSHTPLLTLLLQLPYWNNGPMALGAATGGRGQYRSYDASLLFLDGFLRHKDIQEFNFATWCILPIKVFRLVFILPFLISFPLFSSYHSSIVPQITWNSSHSTSNVDSSTSHQPSTSSIPPFQKNLANASTPNLSSPAPISTNNK